MSLPEFLQPLTESDLPESYLSATILTEAKDLPSMAKQLVDYNRMSGEQIRVPGKDASSDDWTAFTQKLTGKGALHAEQVQAAFLKALGTPDDKDGYSLKPEQLPEGLKWDDDAEKFWKEKFHELKIPAKAAAELMNAFIGREADKGAAAVRANEERQKAIEAEFGQALDSKLSKIMNVANTYGGEEAVALMKTADVTLLSMMAKIAEQFDVVGDGEFNSQGERVMLSQPEAKAQLREVQKKILDLSITGKERQRLEDEAVRLQYLAAGQKPGPTMATTG